jgi:hypothetical protein
VKVRDRTSSWLDVPDLVALPLAIRLRLPGVSSTGKDGGDGTSVEYTELFRVSNGRWSANPVAGDSIFDFQQIGDVARTNNRASDAGIRVDVADCLLLIESGIGFEAYRSRI